MVPTTEVINIIMWPIVILFALVIFRKPLGGFLDRASKLHLKAGDFELESTLHGYLSEQSLFDLAKKHPSYSANPIQTHVTILSVDVKGFTEMSEGYDVNSYAETIQKYLNAVTASVFELGGTIGQIDEFLITAFWGAPIVWENPEERACLAALLLRKNIVQMNKELKTIGYLPLRLKIGLTAGPAMVGNLGSEQRFNFGVIGDVVRIARVVSGMTTNYGKEIIIVPKVKSVLGEKYECSHLGAVNVKGLAEPLDIYSLEDLENNYNLEDQIGLTKQIQASSFVGA